MRSHKALLALSTLVGTIIGAGIFGLPYVVSRAGVIPSLFLFALLGGAVLLLHLMFGEIALRTQDSHRLIGYAEKYIGSWGKIIATFSTVFGVLGALLAYVIIGGEFIQTALTPFLSISNLTSSLVFWAILSFFIIQGIQLITKMEFFMNIALVLVIGAIFAFSVPHLQSQNFTLISLPNFFLPFGVMLFALTGWSAIPELSDFFKQKAEKRSLFKIIIWASVISVVLSVIFAFLVVGVSGLSTTEDALTGLLPFLGTKIIALGALLGLIAVAASFLVLGNYLKNSLRHDFGMPYVIASAVSVVIPILLFLLGIREFILVIGLVGAVIGALEGVMIVLIFQKAKHQGSREPEYEIHPSRFLLYPLIVILAVGAVASIAFGL